MCALCATVSPKSSGYTVNEHTLRHLRMFKRFRSSKVEHGDFACFRHFKTETDVLGNEYLVVRNSESHFDDTLMVQSPVRAKRSGTKSSTTSPGTPPSSIDLTLPEADVPSSDVEYGTMELEEDIEVPLSPTRSQGRVRRVAPSTLERPTPPKKSSPILKSAASASDQRAFQQVPITEANVISLDADGIPTHPQQKLEHEILLLKSVLDIASNELHFANLKIEKLQAAHSKPAHSELHR